MTYKIDYAARKAEGILRCPDDEGYDTVHVVGTGTQKDLDAFILEVRNDKTEWTEELLQKNLDDSGAVDVTGQGFGVIAPLSDR
jgi:hypothetical protein